MAAGLRLQKWGKRRSAERKRFKQGTVGGGLSQHGIPPI